MLEKLSSGEQLKTDLQKFIEVKQKISKIWKAAYEHEIGSGKLKPDFREWVTCLDGLNDIDWRAIPEGKRGEISSGRESAFLLVEYNDKYGSRRAIWKPKGLDSGTIHEQKRDEVRLERYHLHESNNLLSFRENIYIPNEEGKWELDKANSCHAHMPLDLLQKGQFGEQFGRRYFPAAYEDEDPTENY